MRLQKSKLDDFNVNSQGILGTVSSGNDESLLGRLGASVAYPVALGQGYSLTPFVGATVWQNFKNETDLKFIQGGQTLDALTTGVGHFTQFTAGLAIANPLITGTNTGVAGFVRGDWREGGDSSSAGIRGGSISAGGRINF